MTFTNIFAIIFNFYILNITISSFEHVQRLEHQAEIALPVFPEVREGQQGWIDKYAPLIDGENLLDDI